MCEDWTLPCVRTEAGVRVTKRDGLDVIRPERVREAIAERDQSAE